MRQSVGAVVVAAVLSIGLPSAVRAQAGPYWWLGAGPVLPMGDLSDELKTGWMGDLGIGVPIIAKKSSVQAQLSYSDNNVTVSPETRYRTWAGFLNLTYNLMPDAKLGAYVYGGGGFMSVKRGKGLRNMHGAVQGAGGVSYNFSPKVGVFGEARYMKGMGDDAPSLLPILFGVSATFGPGT